MHELRAALTAGRAVPGRGCVLRCVARVLGAVPAVLLADGGAVMIYHLRASTIDGHYLGHVTLFGALPTLLVAMIGAAWLRGLRLRIEQPVRAPRTAE